MQCKKTIDARSYSHAMLETMRRDAIVRIEAGESPEAVAAGLAINRRTIYRWLSAYHYGGEEALKAKLGVSKTWAASAQLGKLWL